MRGSMGKVAYQPPKAIAQSQIVGSRCLPGGCRPEGDSCRDRRVRIALLARQLESLKASAEGAVELSPALQRWVGEAGESSPVRDDRG